MAYCSNAVEEEVEDTDAESFVDNIEFLARVWGDSTGIQNSNGGGEGTARYTEIRTSGNEDQEKI